MKLLWAISTVGTGHVFRNLEIASELAKLIPDLDITFVSGGPAARVMSSYTKCLDLLPVEPVPSTDGWVDIVALARSWLGEQDEAAQVAKKLIDELQPDAILGDETVGFVSAGQQAGLTSIYLTDFLFVDYARPLWRNIRVNSIILMMGWYLARQVRRAYEFMDLTVFLNDPTDLSSFWRNWLAKRGAVVGPIAGSRGAVVERMEARQRLGIDPKEKLIVVTIGGSDAGLYLAHIAREAFGAIKPAVPSARMVIVLGPALDPAASGITPGEGIAVRGYEPDLLSWMAASDLVICNAGFGTLTELAQRAPVPTITSPLGSHWEQEDNAHAAVRAGYAVSISRSKINPNTLAREAIDIVGDSARWQRMAQAARNVPHHDGARLAAQAIADLLARR